MKKTGKIRKLKKKRDELRNLNFGLRDAVEHWKRCYNKNLEARDKTLRDNECLRERVHELENLHHECLEDENRRAMDEKEALAREKAFGSPAKRVRGIQLLAIGEAAPSPNTDVAFLEMANWFVKDHGAFGPYLEVRTSFDDRYKTDRFAIKLSRLPMR